MFVAMHIQKRFERPHHLKPSWRVHKYVGDECKLDGDYNGFVGDESTFVLDENTFVGNDSMFVEKDLNQSN